MFKNQIFSLKSCLYSNSINVTVEKGKKVKKVSSYFTIKAIILGKEEDLVAEDGKYPVITLDRALHKILDEHFEFLKLVRIRNVRFPEFLTTDKPKPIRPRQKSISSKFIVLVEHEDENGKIWKSECPSSNFVLASLNALTDNFCDIIIDKIQSKSMAA